MKLITNPKMKAFSTITASGSAAGFPVSSLVDIDPGIIWKGNATSANIVIDLGSAKSVNHVWLNNANFLSATIQANDTNAWGTPAVSINATLASDDIGIVKGFFDLSETAYRYVRIVIPVQTFLDSESAPWLGNLVIGESDLLKVADWEPQTIEKRSEFEPDGGGFRTNPKGRGRHIFSCNISGTKPQVDSMPLKNWSYAVIFTDLNDVADSYLVASPDTTRSRVRNINDVEKSLIFKELV